ncbi:glyoxalase family protein [Staphylococcus hyicus]|nr:glyoxalase family protein [Staphylococcus hyicus]SQE46864.1 glyoxalase family protein [Staphylococcus hyicus]
MLALIGHEKYTLMICKGVSHLSTIIGHHHISMYTKNISQNKAFYLDVLGLNLIKETVNQDDTTMPHIFYGNCSGDPGTLLTFFEIPQAGSMRKGTNMIARIGLLVENSEVLEAFDNILQNHGISTKRGTYLNQDALYFDDPESLSFVLIANDDYLTPAYWTTSNTTTSNGHPSIIGIGPIEIHVEDIATTVGYLTKQLGFNKRETIANHVYTLNDKGLYTDVVVIQKRGSSVKPGKGYVHHHAFATTKANLFDLVKRHDYLSGHHSGIIDRKWFQSLYYQHNYITYEFATMEPGFN